MPFLQRELLQEIGAERIWGKRCLHPDGGNVSERQEIAWKCLRKLKIEVACDLVVHFWMSVDRL